MGFRDDDDMVIGNYENANTSIDELSDAWQKLLGIHPVAMEATPDMLAIPCAQGDDPWSELLQAQGAKVVDLQHMHLREVGIALSELEVEQALQVMQERPIQGKNQA